MVQLLEKKTTINLGKETPVHISSREKDSERKSPKKPIYLWKKRGQNFRDFCCKFERQFFKNKGKNKQTDGYIYIYIYKYFILL